MTTGRTLDLFITHAWRYHEDWTQLAALLDRSGSRWRNFSVPWHDPALVPSTELGGRHIRDFLETQIIPVDGVVFLSGVYAVRSTREWLDLEVEFARRHP